MKKWGDIIKNMTLLSQFSLSFISSASVPADLLVDEYQPGNRRMDFYSWLFFRTGRLLYSSL